MSVTSLAAGTASAKFAYQTTKEEEAAQEEYNEGLLNDAVRGYGELDEAESDIIYESHAQSLEAQKQALVGRSNLLLQAAGTGAYGQSVNTALTDLSRGFSSRMSEITVNRDRHLNNVVKQAEEIQAGVRRNADRSIIQPAWFTAGMTGLRTAQEVEKAGETFKKGGKDG